MNQSRKSLLEEAAEAATAAKWVEKGWKKKGKKFKKNCKRLRKKNENRKKRLNKAETEIRAKNQEIARLTVQHRQDVAKAVLNQKITDWVWYLGE